MESFEMWSLGRHPSDVLLREFSTLTDDEKAAYIAQRLNPATVLPFVKAVMDMELGLRTRMMRLVNADLLK